METLETLESEVCALLQKYAKDHYAKMMIAPHVAKTSLLMNHLYEDLGFDNRIQMGKFMVLNFPELAKQKPKDVLWKKFIYDSIGKVAPACADCKDSISCFSCIDKEITA